MELFLYFLYCICKFWSDNCCEYDLSGISDQVRQDADGKGGSKGEVHLYCKPYRSEQIADSHTETHPDNGGKCFFRKALHEKPVDERKKNKAE